MEKQESIKISPFDHLKQTFVSVLSRGLCVLSERTELTRFETPKMQMEQSIEKEVKILWQLVSRLEENNRTFEFPGIFGYSFARDFLQVHPLTISVKKKNWQPDKAKTIELKVSGVLGRDPDLIITIVNQNFPDIKYRDSTGIGSSPKGHIPYYKLRDVRMILHVMNQEIIEKKNKK